MRNLTFALTLFVLALAAVAAPASADDESVKAAWDSNDATFERLGKKFRREVKAFNRREYENPRPLIRNLRRSLSVLARTARAVRAEEPSTEGGERAKKLALLSMADFRSQLRSYVRGTKLLARGYRLRGNRWLAKGDRFRKRSIKLARRGQDAFAEAGVEG
jgi:hypothetical protein